MKSFFLSVFIFAAITESAIAQSEGRLFPEIQFETIDGELLKTEDLKGKVVFYNFSFAVCQPCIAQKEGLKELYKKFASDDMLFITITFDNNETIRQFQAAHGMQFKVISIETKEIMRHFGVTSYPTNYLVGIDGTIIMKKTGAKSLKTASKEVLNEFSPAIKSELQKLKLQK
jgi:peroxiredoxin